jgi:methylmalonyl-CoA mutase, N-terminal domain
VNRFSEQGEQPIEILQIDESAAEKQSEKLKALRARRDSERVTECLDTLRRAAAGEGNIIPAMLDAVRAYATTGEICQALRDVFGSWQENAVL